MGELRARVRALQKKMARELAIVRLRRLVKAGLRLPTFMEVNKYLEKLRREKVEIDNHELLRTLIPWVSKYRLDLVWAEEI